jgi:hypothetical protein
VRPLCRPRYSGEPSTEWRGHKSIRDHPRPARRRSRGTVLAAPHHARRSTARTSSAVGGLERRENGWGGAALIGGNALSLRRCRRRTMRRGQHDPRRTGAAGGAVRGHVALGHRPHVGERAAFAAEIFINRQGHSSIGGCISPGRSGRPVLSRIFNQCRLLVQRHRDIDGYRSHADFLHRPRRVRRWRPVDRDSTPARPRPQHAACAPAAFTAGRSTARISYEAVSHFRGRPAELDDPPRRPSRLWTKPKKGMVARHRSVGR